MKHYLQNSLRALFLSLSVLLSLPMLAVEVEIDGINYDLVTKVKVATVIKKSTGSYSGVVVIPESVEHDGTAYSVTGIWEKAFYECYGLTSITIPNSVTSIGEFAFYGCSGLTSVTIPNSVTSIGEFAFAYCPGLTSVTIPNSVTSIGYGAFQRCDYLTSVTIPNSVTSIEGGTFLGCSGLTSVTIPNSVTSIGEYAFEGCSGLTSVTIPNSVTSIEYAAFQDCSGLTSVTIGNSVTSIGSGAFSGCSGLTSITIPNSVTSIENYTFSDCSGLTSVTIPNSVTSIGENAFRSCRGLTSVTIGSGVKAIYSKAFAECSDLFDVYCHAEKVPNTESDAFEGSYIEFVNLHVPDASIEDYRATAPWSQFGKIIGLSGEESETKKCTTPIVTYANGKLSLSCDTEGAEFITKIMSNDINTFYNSEIELTATYNIEVFATKSGYENSDTISVALVWMESGKTGEENGIIGVEVAPVLIQGNNGSLTISGTEKGTKISVYTISGEQVATATATDGSTTLNTGLQHGTVVIVRIGNKSVKIKI